MFWFMLQVDPIQIYLQLKIGLPPILRVESSGIMLFKENDKFDVFDSVITYK